MMDFFKLIIEGVWGILSVDFNIDGLDIKLWHFFALAGVLGFITKLIFGGSEKDV